MDPSPGDLPHDALEQFSGADGFLVRYPFGYVRHLVLVELVIDGVTPLVVVESQVKLSIVFIGLAQSKMHVDLVLSLIHI